jgi:hypothetical protein
MSLIRVDNFGPSAGGTTYSARGIAKAWVNFDGRDTFGIRDSGNVTSITDRGTGLYTLNYTSNMSGSSYSSVGSCADTVTDPSARNRMFTPSVLSSSSSNANTYTTSSVAIDVNLVCASIHGDLA